MQMNIVCISARVKTVRYMHLRAPAFDWVQSFLFGAGNGKNEALAGETGTVLVRCSVAGMQFCKKGTSFFNLPPSPFRLGPCKTCTSSILQ